MSGYVVTALNGASTGSLFGYGSVQGDETKPGAMQQGVPLAESLFNYEAFTVSGLTDWNGSVDNTGNPYTYTITIPAYTGPTSGTNVTNAYISAGNAGLNYLASEPHASSPASIPVFYELTTSESASFPNALYTSIGTDSTTFIDTNHAIHGGDSTVLAACKAIADKYTNDTTETITTTGRFQGSCLFSTQKGSLSALSSQ